MSVDQSITNLQGVPGRFYSWLNTAVKLVGRYRGEEPFANYLKYFFSQNKKFGGKDRKQIAHLCYSYFRLGKAFTNLSIEQQILLGLKKSTPGLTPQWEQLIKEYKVPEEMDLEVFPWKDVLSTGIDFPAFETSFFVQPDLFLRVRPGHRNSAEKKLAAAQIAFEEEGLDALRLANTVKVADVLSINSEVVIQDLSSQKIQYFFELFNKSIGNSKSKISVWDCCAASGGKSIMAVDKLGVIDLTVSDLRASIIENLRKRFRQAGINNFRAIVSDATKPDTQLQKKQFDLVIADVPCTGSGTWSRTPEQLFFFNPAQIATYAQLQQAILKNAVNHVVPGGYLLYSTCSVFRAENEVQAAFLESRGFELLEQQIIEGYRQKADTMFAALLRKK